MQFMRGRGIRQKLTIAAGVLLGLIIVAAVVSLLSNRNLPSRSQVVDRLSSQEKLLLAEALHLKQTLGESLWPGWGQAEIPVQIWNERYGFLVSESNPPANWEQVPGDSFLEKPYFRLAAPSRQAFAVRIGDRWAASMSTKEWMSISMVNDVRSQLPRLLKPVFPYRLLVRFFGLNSSDLHIAAILHESFHAYQAKAAPQRFAEAGAAYRQEARYPWEDSSLQRSWKAELELLAGAAGATSPNEAASLARQFLSHRRQRREQHRLDAALANFERNMEWLEGLAKYIELASWRQASTTPGYNPLPELAADYDFRNYATFPRQWTNELTTMKLQASQRGDVRFYYTGMAQAFLLDRLMPDWKNRALGNDISLEGLLAEATEKQK